MKRVLVTGSNGFVGKHVVKFLAKHLKTDQLHTIVRKEDQVKYPFDHVVDLLDRTDLQRVVGEIKPDVIVHLAGSAAGKPGEFPLLQFDENVHSTYNILHAVPNYCNFILASSVVVYGDTLWMADENYVPKPKSFYAASKLACESLLHTFVATKALQPYILRLPAIVGSGLTHGILKAHLDKVRSNDEIFEVIGDVSGGAKKPYLHVTDLCRVIGFILNENLRSGIYNISPNDTLSAVEVANLVMQHTGINKKIKIAHKMWPTDNKILNIKNEKLSNFVELMYPTSKLAMIQAIHDNSN